jgi:hypothetical protein
MGHPESGKHSRIVAGRAEQGDKGISVDAIRAKDGERHIRYIKGYLEDDASPNEQGDEQAEEEKEARANQR